MNLALLRYAGIALVSAIFGIGGGYLAVNNANRPAPPSGTTVAIPAQPFPGQRIPAIPAVPAQPGKGKPDIGVPTISYIRGEAEKNQVVPPMLTVSYGTPAYIGHTIVGTNFSDKNTVYWDGRILARDVAAVKNSDGAEEIYLSIPEDVTLGSFHDVYVKSPPYGMSNTVKVQAVEHLDIPWLRGVKTDSLKVGAMGTVLVWDSLYYSFWGASTDKPLSAKIYLGLFVPANRIKNGADGYAYTFIPTPLERLPMGPPYDPLYSSAVYSVTLPKDVVYCPSWIWNATDCSLAPPDTKVSLAPGGYGTTAFFDYQFQYRGAEQGLAITGGPDAVAPWGVVLTVAP